MALSRTKQDPSGGRRPSGTLESAVLAVLWDAGRALSPGEVRDRLAARGGEGDGLGAGTGPGSGSGSGSGTSSVAASGGLSYSTVVTILTRLYEKKSLARHRDGRAFRYAPVADEAGLAARRLAALLDNAPDRTAVLSRFVEDLSDRDEQLLRALLGGRPGGNDPGTERA
jgi:predicted transcriptional regulator